MTADLAAAVGQRPQTSLADLADVGEESGRDPVGLLVGQGESRVQDLLPVRHGRMSLNAFSFYRGAALVMADDLSRTPHSGLIVQLCGDAHLSNFGFFATPERQLAFDVNDFDETYPGPFEWDVKRLVASLAVAADDNGCTPKVGKRIARACAAEYRATIANQAQVGTLATWYSHLTPTSELTAIRKLVDNATTKILRKEMKKAWGRNSLQALSKLTTTDADGEVRFVNTPPLIVPVEELVSDMTSEQIVEDMSRRLAQFRESMEAPHRVLVDKFEFVRMARKVVGVGSVGSRAWVLLMRSKIDGTPLLLQAKEAQHSVLDRYLQGPAYSNQGERVVFGQRLTQAVSDVFLGWQGATGFDGVHRDFYVRQLRDAKGSVVIGTLDPKGLEVYGRICGRVLAFGHARSGDPVAISRYLGDTDEFDRAMGRFALSYSERTIRDHQAFVEAIDRGDLASTPGI
ncbi:DUF2252 domain-containing protein [Gordonia sp. CPCC 205515]|uniref:DUF2252 domain-containing protein n=1 Tax=Gordonia sp. CPCC 205515 TaxID=3140791 RepID=UPI003AF3F711